MTCNSCETTFQGSQTLVVSVAKSESSAVLSVANQGRNIALISRILLWMRTPGAPAFCIYARHRTPFPGRTLPLTWNRGSQRRTTFGAVLPPVPSCRRKQNMSRSKDDRAVVSQRSEVNHGTALLEAGKKWRTGGG